jgi:hypothetical protein
MAVLVAMLIAILLGGLAITCVEETGVNPLLITKIAIGLCLITLVIFRRRRRLAVFALCCWLLWGYGFYFAPFCFKREVCPLCGKMKDTDCFCGITFRTANREWELSQWYDAAGLRPHEHHWTFLCSMERDWRGEISCGDSFGFQLTPLHYLRAAHKTLNNPQFESLANDFYAAQNDKVKTSQFCQKCQTLGLEAD